MKLLVDLVRKFTLLKNPNNACSLSNRTSITRRGDDNLLILRLNFHGNLIYEERQKKVRKKLDNFVFQSLIIKRSA